MYHNGGTQPLFMPVLKLSKFAENLKIEQQLSNHLTVVKSQAEAKKVLHLGELRMNTF